MPHKLLLVIIQKYSKNPALVHTTDSRNLVISDNWHSAKMLPELEKWIIFFSSELRLFGTSCKCSTVKIKSSNPIMYYYIYMHYIKALLSITWNMIANFSVPNKHWRNCSTTYSRAWFVHDVGKRKHVGQKQKKKKKRTYYTSFL